MDYGGKGSNQAVGCARLGAHVSFVARIGTDPFGEMALGLYRDEGIDITYVKRTANAPTGVGFIIVEAASGHNCITIDPGANELLTAADVAHCEAAFNSSAVVLTQLEIPVAAAEAALARGREQGAITILNPAPVRPLPPSLLQLVDILTPNQSEAKVLAGLGPGADVEPEAVARRLIRSGVKQVVMTLGENGALIVTEKSSTAFLRYACRRWIQRAPGTPSTPGWRSRWLAARVSRRPCRLPQSPAAWRSPRRASSLPCPTGMTFSSSIASKTCILRIGFWPTLPVKFEFLVRVDLQR